MADNPAIKPGYADPAAPDPNPDNHVLHHNNIDALIWLQSSAEAVAASHQAFALARVRVEQALANAPPGTSHCVFSDLDETLLDNSAYNEWLVTAGRNFDELGSWAEYVNAAVSLANPGAVAFTQWLGTQDVALFYVTSRLDAVVKDGVRVGPGVRDATARNLAALGFPLPDGSDDPARTHLFMKNQFIDGRPTDKFAQYAHVETSRGFFPILWLGDNAADFDPRFRLGEADLDVAARAAVAEAEAARWGTSWIQFPNPVYGGFLQYLRKGARAALADDRNGAVVGAARLPRTADGRASQGRITEKVRALTPWARPAAPDRGVTAPPKAAGHLRFASFNVENLFSRARVLNKDDALDGARVLRAVATLQALLEAEVYDRTAIITTFNEAELFGFISLRSDRVNAPDARSPRFFFHRDPGTDWSPAVSINDAIRGRADWSGSIEFRRDEFSGPQVAALAQVIGGLDADVIVLCEVEDRRALEAFCAQALGNLYPRTIVFDGNDVRGIDVALMTKLPIGTLRTNAFTLDPAGGPPRADGTPERLFSRDCLEVEVLLPGSAGAVAFLCNHLKSKSGGTDGERGTDPKRIRQSREVARIVAERYTPPGGPPRRVVVAGDLNEIPDRNGANGANLGGAKTSIDALLTGSGLANVLRDRLGADAWTYPFARGNDILRQQIDYLLLSPDLAAAVRAAGVERSGQPGTGPTAPERGAEASDHAAIWIDIDPAAIAP